MAYKLQNFQDGEIHRDKNIYLFVKNAKTKGPYTSIEELVSANQPSEQNEPKPIVAKGTKKKTTN